MCPVRDAFAIEEGARRLSAPTGAASMKSVGFYSFARKTFPKRKGDTGATLRFNRSAPRAISLREHFRMAGKQIPFERRSTLARLRGIGEYPRARIKAFISI